MPAIEEITTRLREIVAAAEKEERDLTDEECAAYEQTEVELEAARRSAGIVARQQAYDTPVTDSPPPAPAPAHPLAVTPAALAGIQAAIDARTSGRFAHDLTPEQLRIQNAALTTSTFGQPGEWGANVLAGPRILHAVAGVPSQSVDAVLAEFPQLTLPTAQASVGEGASLVEYASSAGGTVTLGRFGRFTDLTKESTIGTNAAALVAMHSIGIAKDLDSTLITAVEAAAGGPAAFSDPQADVKTAAAKVIDATAAEDIRRLVLLVHPDNVALFQDVNPTGGATIAEAFQRFAGMIVYPSTAVTTGLVTVANLAAGARYFTAMRMATVTDEDVKTGVRTVATAIVAGYGVTLTSGFAEQVDVVTP